MFKNVAGQKLRVFAFDATTNLPKTGDQANITASVSKDYGAVTDLTDTSATQEDSTKAPGYYLFDLTAAEVSGDYLGFSGRSSTANVVVIAVPAVVFTRPKVVLRDGTAQSGGANNIQLDAGASATNNFYSDAMVVIVDGTGAGQVRPIYQYVGANKTVTIHPNYPWIVNPDNTSKFVIIANTDQAKGGYIDQALQFSSPTTTQIADEIFDQANGVETGKTFREAVKLMAAVLAGKRSNSGTATEQFDAIGNPGTARVIGNLNSSGDGTPTLTP